MASKKKKKSFAEQVISGSYESSMTREKVAPALKKTNKSITKANSQKEKFTDGSLFSAFEDGYNFGDVTKTILKGGAKLGKTVYETGKEVVTNPIQSVKTFGVGAGEGFNKANDLVNDAVGDFFDWIVPGREDKTKDDVSVSIIELDKFSKTASTEEKQKVLKEYEKKFGKDDPLYKSAEVMLTSENKEDKNILNMKYYDTDTYKKAVDGELSEGQKNVYGVGENIGQMVPSVGVSMIAGPGAGSALFFTQSQQSYTEQAIERGYDEGEARTYGLIMGGAEVLVERLGFDELGGLKKLSNTSVKKAMVGEGLEEFVMPYVDDVVTYTGFEDGYSWEEFGESSEEALEGAVMGATVGAIMSAGGRGLSKVDSFIEKVNSGQEITQEDIVQAGKELQENSPELLEEAMKGVPEVVKQELSQTQDVTAEDISVQEDIAPVGEEIQQLEQDNIPIIENNVVQQAGEQDIAPVEMPQQTGTQEEQVSEQVDETELKRRNYVYQASETDSQLTRELKESASRVMNDTTRSHEFVETVSKIAERTQTKYKFTNTEELNAQGYGVEGKRVNGLVTADGEILINIDSQKALNTIVGHETTHLLEGTKEYQALQDAVFKYAQTKGTFEAESDRISSIYAGQKNVNIDNELTSELVGDYLFTDQQFLDNLSAEQPNIFKRIYNEIKHWINMATAGSKEAKQLEELKYRFEKALNSKQDVTKQASVEEIKQTTTQETKDNSVVEVESNIQEKTETVQEIEDTETSKVSENVEVETKIEDNAEEYSLSVDNKGRKLTETQEEFFENSKVRDENGNLLTMYHGTSSGGYTIFDPFGGRPGLFGQGSYFTADNTVAESYTEKGRGNNKQIYEVYLNITNPIDMDAQANVEEWKQYFSKHLPDATFPESGTNEALYRSTLEEFENTEYDRVEVAEIMVDTFQKMGYDGITHIGGGRFNQKDNTRHRVYITFESNQIKEATNKNPTEDSDIRYSLSETTTDNQGRELSKEQQEYFKDSKVRDKQGNLLTIYHGTHNDFTIFDKSFIGKNTNNEGIFGKGFYFTNNYNMAERYDRFEGHYYPNADHNVMELYANLKNPFIWNDIDTKEKMEAFIEETGMPKYVLSWNNFLKNQISPIIDTKAERKFSEVLQKNGYDGVIYSYNDRYDTKEIVVFNSNQIKNVDNTSPTDSDDIRQSMSNLDEDIAPTGDYNVYGSEVGLQQQVEEAIAPLQEKVEELTKVITDLQENIAPASFETAEEQRAETQRTLGEGEAPLTEEGTFSFLDEAPIEVKNKRDITYDIQDVFNIKHTEAREIYNKIASMPELTVEDIYAELENHKQVKVQEQDDYYKDIQNYIKGTKLDVSEIKNQITDYDNTYRMANMGKGLTLANSGQAIDSFYQELNELYPNVFPESVTAEADQLDLISQVMFRDTNLTYTETLDDDTLQILAEKLYSEIGNRERYKSAEAHQTNWFKHYRDMIAPGEEAPIRTEATEETYLESLKNLPDVLDDSYAPYLEMAREVNASNTEQTSELASIMEELNRLDTEKAQEVNEAENEPTIAKNPIDEIMDNFISRLRGERTQTPVQRVEKSKLRNAVDTGKRLFVNEMAETDNIARETGNLDIKFKGDMLNAVGGEIEGEIYTAQTDNEGHQIGSSLNGLFAEAKETGLYEPFNHYLELQSNIDRHKQGKGSKVSLIESEQLVKQYENTYPQFKEWGKGVWWYGKNIRNNLVDAGLIDQQFADRLGEMYPHYVPYVEQRDVSNYYPDLGEIKSTSVIKRAKGGASNLLPIEEALTKYTFASKKAVRQNQFYQELVSTLDDKVSIGGDVRSDATDLETSLYRDETGNYLTAYFNGQQQSVRISDDLYTSLKNDLKHQIEGLEQKFAIVTDPVQKLSEIRRNLLTSWNPMFIIRNPIMDVQDAVFNSKYTKDFVKNYPGAFVELARAKSDTARQFLTLYGSGNVMGEHSTDGSIKNSKFLKGVQKANNIMELAPRYAEFKASLENGASVQEAMYNAREVTANFSRGGTITKALNKNGFTFLNVSVQGFDKFIRNFSGENGAKGVAGSLLKASIFGVLPAVFNELAFGGDDDEEKDEEYDALPDYIKDNYYLIKTGDGEFIRIPKGRILSVFGSAGRRTLEYMQGEEDAFEGFLKNANSQVGVSNPLDSNILTPLFQAFGSENGEAWYGGDIVPSRLQGKAPEEQYDASTDKFSIWLGDKLKDIPIIGEKIASPYKINYVLDQYSGGIGDIFLPMITEEATNDVEGPGVLLAPIKDQFTANSTFDNKYASEIYTLSDKMDKLPTATKETDEYKIQDSYLYSVTSEMAELYAERREVQADKTLSKSEKYEKVQAIQDQINSLAKEGLDNYQNVSKTDNYAIVGGREFNKYTTDSGEERWGKVYDDILDDMNSMGMDLDEKSEYFKATSTISTIQADYKGSDDYVSKKRDVISVIKDTNLNDEQKGYLYDKYYGNTDVVNSMVTLGVDMDSFLDYESQNFEADKDENGKSISGSKKFKVFDYINSMNIDFEQRVILAKLQYNSYDEYNYEIVDYLNNSDLTYEEEVVLLEKLGFTVDENGKIYW